MCRREERAAYAADQTRSVHANVRQRPAPSTYLSGSREEEQYLSLRSLQVKQPRTL